MTRLPCLNIHSNLKRKVPIHLLLRSHSFESYSSRSPYLPQIKFSLYDISPARVSVTHQEKNSCWFHYHMNTMNFLSVECLLLYWPPESEVPESPFYFVRLRMSFWNSLMQNSPLETPGGIGQCPS